MLFFNTEIEIIIRTNTSDGCINNAHFVAQGNAFI